jgi:hypothetical protein
VAVAYVCAGEAADLDQQRAAVKGYARDEGLALAQILTDRFDGFTISQLVQTARFHDARLVIIPADARLATARARVAADLESHGAVCVVIGEKPAATTTERPRLAEALPRCTIPMTPEADQ